MNHKIGSIYHIILDNELIYLSLRLCQSLSLLPISTPEFILVPPGPSRTIMLDQSFFGPCFTDGCGVEVGMECRILRSCVHDVRWKFLENTANPACRFGVLKIQCSSCWGPAEAGSGTYPKAGTISKPLDKHSTDGFQKLCRISSTGKVELQPVAFTTPWQQNPSTAE